MSVFLGIVSYLFIGLIFTKAMVMYGPEDLADAIKAEDPPPFFVVIFYPMIIVLFTIFGGMYLLNLMVLGDDKDE